jgi:hypothetical protein
VINLQCDVSDGHRETHGDIDKLRAGEWAEGGRKVRRQEEEEEEEAQEEAQEA